MGSNKPKVWFAFSGGGLRASSFSSGALYLAEKENFERNNGRLLRQIYGVYESARYAFFSIDFFNNSGHYIYDKKTNASYSLSKIKPDTVNYYLPLFISFTMLIQDKDIESVQVYMTVKYNTIHITL